jgi:hypothetical protein
MNGRVSQKASILIRGFSPIIAFILLFLIPICDYVSLILIINVILPIFVGPIYHQPFLEFLTQHIPIELPLRQCPRINAHFRC